jgi:pimeloyl-ACP methyl ester carboxylesterase
MSNLKPSTVWQPPAAAEPVNRRREKNVVAALPVPMIKGELAVDRFTVPYRVCGDGTHGLVFVNGLQQSMSMWHSFVRRFSRIYRIAIFDFPNHGRGRIVDGPADITIEEQVRILDAVIDAAKITDTLTVCSASWGGVVAASHAIQNPGKVQRLILASMGTRANDKMIDMITKGFGVRLENRIEIADTIIQTFGADLPPQMKRKILRQFQYMDEAALEAFHRHGLFVLKLRELRNAVDVGQIRCKTIVVHGEKDTIVDADDAQLLASQIGNAEFKSIAGVGHFLHLENEDILDTYEEILAASC